VPFLQPLVKPGIDGINIKMALTSISFRSRRTSEKMEDGSSRSAYKAWLSGAGSTFRMAQVRCGVSREKTKKTT